MSKRPLPSVIAIGFGAVTDRALLAEYGPKGIAVAAPYGMETFAISASKPTRIEGWTTPDAFVVEAWPSMERFYDCYNSPEYKKINELRYRCSTTELFVFENRLAGLVLEATTPPVIAIGFGAVTDRALLAEYGPKGIAVAAPYGMETFAISASKPTRIEGWTTPDAFVVEAWPSMERFYDCYNSPEYKKINELRYRCSTTELFVFENMKAVR